MSTVAEIEAAIAKLTPVQQREIANWMAEQLVPEETPAMLAALDAGIRSLAAEPTIPIEDVRRKVKAWTAR